jgi:DNA-binding response OmpR family regulator
VSDPTSAVRRPRVLIVEDEWMIAELLEMALEDNGYEVAGPTATVSQAMAMVMAGGLDAAVLDVSLDREPSFPIAKALDDGGVPYLFMTGYAEADMPAEFRTRTILHKPFTPEVLALSVSTLLARL